MKILITTDWYAPAVNGVVTSVLNLSRELEKRGHQVRILTLSQTTESFRRGNVTYIGSVGAGRIYPGARLRTALAGKWIKELIDWAPDVVHSQCEFSTFFMARRIAQAADAPLVHTYHTVYEDYTHYFSPSVRFGRGAVRRFTCWVADQADCMIAPTGKVAELLRGYGVSCPVHVVPTGIDLAKFSAPASEERRTALRDKLGLAPGELTLVFVGRLAEEKNLDEVLDELAPFRGERVKLLLVGDGPCREELEQRAGELGLTEQVVFAGMVSPDRVADYYRAGDVFVSASTSETQGLTYLEALCSGLPALCRADPCLDGVVEDGENGWQYRGGEDFASRLRELADSPALRERLAAGARKSAEKFSAAEFARRAEEIYHMPRAERQEERPA